MILGGWTRRLPPLPGELLTSCLARNAYAHASSPYRFLTLFLPRDPVWNRDFDRHPRALGRASKARSDWLADIAGKLQVPVATIEAATLQKLRQVLSGGHAGVTGDTPLLLSAGVYHRTRRCHACGGLLTAGCAEGVGYRLSDGALLLQHALLALAEGETGIRVGPWLDRTVFDGVRALVAVSAPRLVHAALRDALGLPASLPGPGRLRFEQVRTRARVAWMQTAAAWLADWPQAFRAGAHGAGLTQRSFARRHLPSALADEVARLPDGIARDRTWAPVLDEPVLRRLRRTDRAAYSRVRAARILEHCGEQRERGG